MGSRDEQNSGTQPLWTAEGNTNPSLALGGGKSLRHELRTPLNQIIGYAEMLQEDAEDEGNAALAADLKKIERAGRRLLKLINQLTAKPEEAHAAPPPTPRPMAPPPVPLPALPGTPTVRQLSDTLVDVPKKNRVLVVDDVETNRDMLARRLQRKGFEADPVPGGRAALEALEQKTYDMIILDVMMPDIDGFEVLERVRRKYSVDELPIIMATARDSNEDVVKALKLGANDYVTKPLDFGVVMARVNTQMALKKARDRARLLYQKLEDAQEKIASLASSSLDAMNDVGAWANNIAQQLEPAISARRIETWIFEEDDTRSLSSNPQSLPPAIDSVRVAAGKGTFVRRQKDTVVPVVGISGEAFGALVVDTAGQHLSGPAMRLLNAFARQLGGALELKKMREELARTAETRRLNHQQMIEQGIELMRVCTTCGRCYPHESNVCEDDGSELPDPLSLPYRIGSRYRMVREFGHGGMGTVYEGLDERLDRPVAIKVVSGEHFTDETLRVRFENEAKAAARVEHEGVVAVFDSGELPNGSLYLVMELLRGCDLGEMIKTRGPGTPHEVAALVNQAGSALAAAHRAFLVHRDIKPENIYLVPTPGSFRVKLLDFGVAKQMSSETSLTQTGALIGTPLFMSPEQILGKRTDASSDLYSLCSVVYLALSGRRVTLGETLPEILLDVVQQEPPPMSSLVPGIPKEVDELIATALAKSPDDRPKDVASWAIQLSTVLLQLPPMPGRWLSDDGSLILPERSESD